MEANGLFFSLLTRILSPDNVPICHFLILIHILPMFELYMYEPYHCHIEFIISRDSPVSISLPSEYVVARYSLCLVLSALL